MCSCRLETQTNQICKPPDQIDGQGDAAGSGQRAGWTDGWMHDRLSGRRAYNGGRPYTRAAGMLQGHDRLSGRTSPMEVTTKAALRNDEKLRPDPQSLPAPPSAVSRGGREAAGGSGVPARRPEVTPDAMKATLVQAVACGGKAKVVS